MNDEPDELTAWSQRDRLLKGLPRMMESGRVTASEADRLRSATEQGPYDEVVQEIRVRHAGGSLGEAVADGSISQDEADGVLDRLRSGEHSRSIRRHLPRRHSGPETSLEVVTVADADRDLTTDRPSHPESDERDASLGLEADPEGPPLLRMLWIALAVGAVLVVVVLHLTGVIGAGVHGG